MASASRPAAPSSHGVGNGPEIAGEHSRPAQCGRGHVRGASDGFEQDAFERALTQLAGEQAAEELLLVARRAPEERPERCRSPGGRSPSGEPCERLEGAVDFTDTERRAVAGRDVSRRGNRAITRADPPLANPTREERDHRFDLLERRSRNQVGQPRRLVQTPRQASHIPRRDDDFGKLHRYPRTANAACGPSAGLGPRASQ